MIDELRLNTKLVGFDGIIGRRDCFLNTLYICMLNLLVSYPFTLYLMSNIETPFDFIYMNKVFYHAPILLQLWTIIGTAGILYISVSNIIRRLNDINGEVNKKINIVTSLIFILAAYGILFPTLLNVIFILISTIIGLVLLFKKGKITGKYPYDFLKEFNWGAFFGTWIWGLFNKSYKTLWMLLLGLTPWSFYYALVCGLKGNEWAYKNKQWESVEKFTKSQETQTLIFVILSVVIMPIFYMIITMAIVFALAFTFMDETKTAPDQPNKMVTVLNQWGSLYFEGHTITEDENKYYVLPSDWQSSSYSEKQDMLNMAATMAATERKPMSRKTEELPRTKIYSSTNGELLGEFVLDESIIENGSVKEIITASMKAYRFYKPSKI